jgi:hypothetical protein
MGGTATLARRPPAETRPAVPRIGPVRPPPERRPTPAIDPRPSLTTGYSGTIAARRDAVLGSKLSTAPDRSDEAPDFPAYLTAPVGRLGPPEDDGGDRADTEPTPDAELPPLRGLASETPVVAPESDSSPAEQAEAAPEESSESAAEAGGGTDSGDAAAPEAATEVLVATGGGSGVLAGGAGGGGAARSERRPRQDDSEDLTPLASVPEVERGTVTLSRPGITVDTSAPQFDAPRTLAVRTKKATDPLDPGIARYEAIYGQAAAASYGLYAQIVSGLDRMGAEARAEADRASTRRQRDLDEGLRALDDGLASTRGRLRVSLHDDLTRLDAAAYNARQRINRAASSGIGRLRARARRVETDLRGKRRESSAIAALPGQKIAELETARTRVGAALATLQAHADPLLPQPDNEHTAFMKAAEYEAMVRDIAFPVREAGLEMDESVERMRTGLQAQVDPTNRSLCMSFCPFENMKTMLANEGEQAIGRARAQSLEQLGIMHRKIRRQLEKSLHEGDRTLVTEHRTQRRRLIEAAGDRQRTEQAQHQQQARTGSSMLAASAGAQGVALASIHDRIAARADRGEAALATAASEFSKGLLANGVPRGWAQLAAIESRIVGAAATLARIGRMASQRFLEGARGAVSAFQDDARRTDDAAADQVRQADATLTSLAKPITETVDGFISSVNQNFATAMTSLEGSLSQIRQGLNDNFMGIERVPPAPSGEAAQPGGQCDTCPPAPAPAPPGRDDGVCREGPEPVNAFILRINGYAAAPATERNVASYRTAVPTLVFNDIVRRSRALQNILCYSDSAPYSVLNELRGITALQGRALEEKFNESGRNLRNDLDWFLNAGNPASGITTRTESIRAARDYLNGNVASGARHELNVCVNWSNDSAQIDIVMKSLTPEQMAQMFHDYKGELDEVRGDLNDLDGRVFDALKAGHVGEAIALRGQAAIDTARESRGYTGTDKAGDAITAMYREAATSRLSGGPALSGIEGARTRAARVAEEWANIQSSFATIVGPEYNRLEGGAQGPPQAGDALINYATRGISYEVDVPNEYGEGFHRETRFDAVNEAQRRLITALVRHHAGSPEANAARLALEASRPGGADPGRVHEATYDEALNPALIVVGAPGGIAAARARHEAALENQRRTYQLLDEYALADGVCRDRPTADIRAELADRLAATLAHDPERAAYVRSLVLTDPRDQADFVNQTVHQLDYAMEGAGTNVDAMRRALASLTREQYQLVKARWAETHNGEDLDIRIGIPGHGTWFERLVTSETSGDTAQEMERLRFGIATTEQQQAELAALEMYQQIRDAGWLGKIVAGSEFDQLEADYRHLLSGMGASGMRIGLDGEMQFLDADGVPTALGHFDSEGRFQAQPGFTAEDLALAITVGRTSAAAYKAATDRIADMIATALVVTAAIVTTALTGGAAASIWIPVLVTAAAGVAAMGVKWAIKGGRYGSEEMLFDLASTIIMAATAGIGAAAGAALRGGSRAVGALAKSWRLSEQALATAAAGGVTASRALPALTLGQELFIGAMTAGFAGGANAAIAPDSWRSDNYARDILAGIMRGALGGAIGAGVARGVGKLAGPLGEIPARGLASGASGAASRVAELTFDDVVMGRHVTWSEFSDQVSTAFLQNLVQGLGEGIADVGMRGRFASRRAEHEWHQAHSHEAYLERAAAVKRMAEAELARRGVPANDNPPPIDTVPEIDPAAPPRRPGAVAEEPARTAGPPRAVDEEPGRAAAPLRADDEPIPMLRSAGGPDEPEARLRSGSHWDDDKTPAEGTRIDHPTFPEGVDLRPGMLDNLPIILPDTDIRATNKYDPEQARMNYEVMRARQPDREVMLAYNPTTGEYFVRQGFPRTVRPPPEGFITLRHSHPRVVGGDLFAHFATILPSGLGGDFAVLKTEVDRLAGGRIDVEFRRTSVIDIEINGQRLETHFSITKLGDNYSLTVTLIPPQHGVSTMGPFPNIREYAYAARDLTSAQADFGLGHNRTTEDMLTEGGRPDAPRRVVRGDPLSPADRTEADLIAARMRQADVFDQQARGLAERGDLDPLLGRNASISEAHAAVRRLGLVGQEDSLARLTNLINDSHIPPEVRAAVASAALEATRAELIRTGALAPGDDVLMLFRGVTADRMTDYEREGMNLAKLGSGVEEDAARGLYGSQDLQSAMRYTGQQGGAVLPLIVRRSELGNVIDVRSGTPLGERWLAFIRASQGKGRLWPGHEHLRRVLDPSVDFPIALVRDGRGARFEEFLKRIADDPTMPDSVRAAARNPHLTLMDLGGVASTGNDRGILTDQWAMHSQHIADLFNQAHGFPIPGREGPGSMSRPALAPDESGGGDMLRSAAATKKVPDAPTAAPPAERRPRTIQWEGQQMINRAIAAAQVGDSIEAAQLRQLMAMAPDATRAILREIATESFEGRMRNLTDEDVLSIRAEITRRGGSMDDAMRIAANIVMVAAPGTRLHQLLSEAPFIQRLQSSLRSPLEDAAAERAAVRAARDFARRASPNAERRALRQLLDLDTEGIVRMITGEGSWSSRTLQFAMRRFRGGVPWRQAISEAILAARILGGDSFIETHRRWQNRADVLTHKMLADLVRARPDMLLNLARTSPRQLAEWFADYVLRQRRSVPPRIDANEFADYVRNRMTSNVLPIASEASSIWSNLARMGLRLLKGDAVMRGGANRPGLDIVGFSVPPGARVRAGDMVRVVVMDDKAYRSTTLESVSAMTGRRLPTNLRSAANEIEMGIRALVQLGEHTRNPEIADFIWGARAAVRQMRNAARELEAIPRPPTGDLRNRAYLSRVAEVLRRNNIVPIVSSEYGNVRAVAQWLRIQGFFLDDEYAEILARELQQAGRLR